MPVAIPHTLLVTLRDLDMPDDPEELIPAHQSLNVQRRLGLSRVVLGQIRRYETTGEDVMADEVANLFTLVGRRPDAPSVFKEAGHRIARGEIGAHRLGTWLAARLLPSRLRAWRAWKRVDQCARRLAPGASIERGSGVLSIEAGLPVHTTEGGAGCALLSGFISEMLDRYRAAGRGVAHSRCEARGDDACVWESLAETAAATGSESASESEKAAGR